MEKNKKKIKPVFTPCRTCGVNGLFHTNKHAYRPMPRTDK